MIAAALSLLLSATAVQPATATEIEKLEAAFNGAYERNQLDDYFSYYADDATLWFESGRVNLADYKKDWYALIKGGGSGGAEER